MPNTGLPKAEVIGIPLRGSIISLDRFRLRAQARQFFGLHPTAPTLLAFGGSQGAQSINNAVASCAGVFGQRGIGVLHATGPNKSVAVAQVPGAPLAFRVAESVMQLPTHGTHHRAQALAMLRRLGVPAPDVSYVAYARLLYGC